ncbi:MAG: hypothetical protein H6R19_891 [Proteobacteria bacterium]|nr:hypothetical protein [Pseudomonadota bacterium]
MMSVQSLTVPEEFTVHQVGEFAPRLLEAARSGDKVQVDLSGVHHIDTAGIQLLLTLRREASRSLTRLEFANPSPAVNEMVAFYQLDALLRAPAPLMSA